MARERRADRGTAQAAGADALRAGVRFELARLVPQGVEIDGEALVARHRVDDAARDANGFHIPPAGAQLKDFEAVQRRIDDTVKADSEGGKLAGLLDSVAPRIFRPRRDDDELSRIVSAMSAQAASVISGPSGSSGKRGVIGTIQRIPAVQGRRCCDRAADATRPGKRGRGP